jgi:hypothetical protein
MNLPQIENLHSSSTWPRFEFHYSFGRGCGQCGVPLGTMGKMLGVCDACEETVTNQKEWPPDSLREAVLNCATK